MTKNTLHAHIIPNIVKISLKGVKMIFLSRKQKINSRQRPQDMTELSTNYVFYLQETQVRNYLVFKHSIKRFIDYQFFFYYYDYIKKKKKKLCRCTLRHFLVKYSIFHIKNLLIKKKYQYFSC